MNYGKAIYHILNTDNDLVTLLGGTPKIYPVEIPQETPWPAVVYTKIQQTPNHTKDSTSLVDEVRMQIDVFATSYSAMEAIDEKIRELLDYFRGVVNTVAIDSIHFLSSSELLDEELNLKHTATDYHIRINRNGTLASITPNEPIGANWTKQIFTDVEGTEVTVTIGVLPTTDIANRLEVYRGGRLLIEGEDFTIDATKIKFLGLPLMSENIIINLRTF